jgi:hypothetical protein
MKDYKSTEKRLAQWFEESRDLTVELGQEKCLVILGVSQEHYIAEVLSKSRALN